MIASKHDRLNFDFSICILPVLNRTYPNLPRLTLPLRTLFYPLALPQGHFERILGQTHFKWNKVVSLKSNNFIQKLNVEVKS